MGFWTKLTMGLALMGQILVALLSLETVGGTANTPEARLQVEDRVFMVRATVRRIA